MKKIKTMKDILSKITFVNFFCVVFGFASFVYLWWLSYMAFTYKSVPTDISEIKMSIIGLIGTIGGYVVGSSVGSTKKSDTIDKVMSNTTEP